MRTKGTAAELEVRRRIAANLLGQKITLAEIAQLLDVSLSSVKRWKKAFQQGGLAALAPKRHPGPSSKLSLAQKRRLRQILLDGPIAAGFPTDLWTCRRVAEVIRQEFEVSYNADHLGRVLHALGFSPQKPQRRARERDEQAIRRWRKHDWPRIKKRDGGGKLSLSFSTKPAFSCNP
jgi:transposase